MNLHPKTAARLEAFYNGEVPDYILDATGKYLVIRTGSDWQGESDHKITLDDVARYYATDARNILSGCRTLGDVSGDWRNIDGLASECLAWFKLANLAALRMTCREYGLEPRF
jgi:hypothetical protein